jgi:Cu/Ag efflux protein CusF
MRKTLISLALVVAVSLGFVQPVIASSMSARPWNNPPVSERDWYNRIESSRKKGADRPCVRAVIRGVNPLTGEITISHGPIPHAKMPAMTMTFPVRDPSDLTAHRVGDRVQIQVADDGGVIKIMHIRGSKRQCFNTLNRPLVRFSTSSPRVLEVEIKRHNPNQPGIANPGKLSFPWMETAVMSSFG